ncbi:MAG: TIM barrel protein [Anaerolineales bacterium]|nr:TIM barrel protein [Anaerolineales bacterium]
MKFSVCSEMIFLEYPFLQRIEKAAAAGFDAIEFWNWDNKDLPAIQAAVQRAGIGIASFQANLRGTLIDPDQRAAFVAGVQQSLDKAREMGVRALFLLTDELGPDRGVAHQFPGLSEGTKRQSVLEGLKALAPRAEKAGVTLSLEPLNTLVDHKGYWLSRSRAGLELVREVNSPNIRLLYDIYHMQVTEGNLIQTLVNNLDAIGHIHVADVPGRHEPGTGEINYSRVFAALREAGYTGFVGMEFEPTIPSEKAAAEALALAKG